METFKQSLESYPLVFASPTKTIKKQFKHIYASFKVFVKF